MSSQEAPLLLWGTPDLIRNRYSNFTVLSIFKSADQIHEFADHACLKHQNLQSCVQYFKIKLAMPNLFAQKWLTKIVKVANHLVGARRLLTALDFNP